MKNQKILILSIIILTTNLILPMHENKFDQLSTKIHEDILKFVIGVNPEELSPEKLKEKTPTQIVNTLKKICRLRLINKTLKALIDSIYQNYINKEEIKKLINNKRTLNRDLKEINNVLNNDRSSENSEINSKLDLILIMIKNLDNSSKINSIFNSIDEFKVKNVYNKNLKPVKSAIRHPDENRQVKRVKFNLPEESITNK